MSKIKNDLLKEIERKAQKIRDNRVTAANNKSLESAVFEFFKNMEEARAIHNNLYYDEILYDKARKALQERVSGFDPGAKISIEWIAPIPDVDMKWNEQIIRGVTIWYSKIYIMRNNIDPSRYVDVSEMLFL